MQGLVTPNMTDSSNSSWLRRLHMPLFLWVLLLLLLGLCAYSVAIFGAIVVNETKQGYGRCVYRCFEEALRYSDGTHIALCEGDSTFRAFDLDKFSAYLAHAEIVNGTRIVEQLRAYSTQLSTFMYYGN